MDDESALGEKERVRLDLPWRINDFLHLLFGKIWHVINELPFVCTVWDDKAESEGVISYHTSSEVMAFDHLHVLDWSGSNTEHHSQSNCL